ncbi:TPA: hypothetical protein ACSP1O_002185 [Aeromonas veronii]
MGRSIQVKIGQTIFKSKKAAVRYFMDQREAIKASGPVTEGTLFGELKELYTRFCDASPGWALNGRNIVSFIVDFERRQAGQQYASHLCFKVKFSNDELRPFSIDEAITAITR